MPEWRERLGLWVRELSYRIDGRSKVRATQWTFTFGPEGVEFHEDPISNRRQRGCRLWYSDADYYMAHEDQE